MKTLLYFDKFSSKSFQDIEALELLLNTPVRLITKFNFKLWEETISAIVIVSSYKIIAYHKDYNVQLLYQLAQTKQADFYFLKKL